jgi:hypothetical protein
VTAAAHTAAADRIEAEANLHGRGCDLAFREQFGEMLPHVARLRADFEFDIDPGVEINSIERALQCVLGRRKAVAARSIGAREDDGESCRAVFEIVQCLHWRWPHLDDRPAA